MLVTLDVLIAFKSGPWFQLERQQKKVQFLKLHFIYVNASIKRLPSLHWDSFLQVFCVCQWVVGNLLKLDVYLQAFYTVPS